MARKRQVLDVVIVRGTGEALVDPCDGLEDLRPHNLLTYKSGQERLDTWAIEEPIGHYVTFNKSTNATARQVSRWPIRLKIFAASGHARSSLK